MNEKQNNMANYILRVKKIELRKDAETSKIPNKEKIVQMILSKEVKFKIDNSKLQEQNNLLNMIKSVK